MDSLETVILLMFMATILVGISQKIHLAYPIGLIAGGAIYDSAPS